MILISAAPNPLPTRARAPQALEFRLLGPVEVWRGGDGVDVGGPLQRALIACLALHPGKVVSREHLIDVLWEEAPPARAARTLETKVSRLRSAFGADTPVVARGGGYVLDVGPDCVDVHRFEQLAEEGGRTLADDPRRAKDCFVRALQQWTGDALGGVPDGVLSVERRRLENERLEVIEGRIDADLALGAGAGLVAELKALCEENPLRERLTERLMVALYRSGRQADALAAYRTARERLVGELGLEPGPGLRDLEQAVLCQDESLGPLALGPKLRRTARDPRALTAVAAACVAVLVVVVAIAAKGGPRTATRPLEGVVLLDGRTGGVRDSVPLGVSNGPLALGYGFVWAMSENGIMSQIDPRSAKLVRSIAIGVQAADFASGAGGVWVTDRNGPTLLRVHPGTGQIDVRARLSSRGLSRPEPNGGIAIDAGSLWIARGTEAVDRIDPSTLRLRSRVRVHHIGCGTPQCQLAAGDGRVWMVGSDDGTLTGIDESSNRVVSTTRLRPYLCCVEVGGGSVWVGEAHDVAQLSRDGHLLRRFDLGKAGVGELSYDGRYLWAVADSTSRVLRIDPRDGRVRSTRVGPSLIGAAAGHGIVAVTAVAPLDPPPTDFGPRVVRIGLTQDWLNTTDPAVTGSPTGTGRWQWQLHHATCAQLYQAPAAGGAAAALQPELATDLPRVGADGRASTIPIRQGMRFSPPLNRPVNAEDVRATLVRALTPQPGHSVPAARVLRDVIGAGAYGRGRATGVAGITAQSDSIVIRTRRPVHDLAARLALPYFCVLPAGTPAVPGGYQEPLPTAGPYYLAAHAGGESAVLRPNPGYRGSRPRHLSALVFDLNVDDSQGVGEVRRGRLDYFAGSELAVSARLGCRATRPQVPGYDLATLCLRSPSR